MAYIGKEPIVGNFQKCDAITVVNGQAAYTLQVSSTNVVPESANHMLVSLNGVLQAPITSFTVSGSTLTFASNLATGDVIDFVMLLGAVLNVGVPSDDSVTLAKMASGTDGNLITYDASGNPAAVATGSDGQVLTSAGAGQPPAFEALSAGKILQVVQDIKTDTASIASTTPAAISGLTLDITPATSSSKILLMCSLGGVGHQTADLKTYFKFYGGNTATYLGDSGTGYECAMTVWNGQAGYAEQNGHMSYLDSPATTSAVTYTVYWWNSSGTSYINRTHTHNTESANTACSLIAMEVGA